MYRGVLLGVTVVPGFEQPAQSSRTVRRTVSVDHVNVTQAGALDLHLIMNNHHYNAPLLEPFRLTLPPTSSSPEISMRGYSSSPRLLPSLHPAPFALATEACNEMEVDNQHLPSSSHPYVHLLALGIFFKKTHTPKNQREIVQRMYA